MKSVFAISTERPSSCSTRSYSSRRSVTSRIFSSCSSLTFDAGTGREKGGKKCHQWNLDLEDENWNVEIYIYTYIYKWCEEWYWCTWVSHCVLRNYGIINYVRGEIDGEEGGTLLIALIKLFSVVVCIYQYLSTVLYQSIYCIPTDYVRVST